MRICSGILGYPNQCTSRNVLSHLGNKFSNRKPVAVRFRIITNEISRYLTDSKQLVSSNYIVAAGQRCHVTDELQLTCLLNLPMFTSSVQSRTDLFRGAI